MKTSREAILEKIMQAVQQPGHYAARPDDAEQKVAEGLKAAIPAGGLPALAEQFKKEIEKVSGECYIVDSEESIAPVILSLLQELSCSQLAVEGHENSRRVAKMLQQQMPHLQLVDAMTLDYTVRRTSLAETPAALVTADYGIADAGTLVVFYDKAQSNMAHFLPTTIFTLLPMKNLRPNLFDTLAQLDKEKAKNMVLITGPSRTADIEKILILGAHGPKRLVVFIVA